MLKKLPKTSHQLSVCEANFLRLRKILQNFVKDSYRFETINPDTSSNKISIQIIQRSPHTLIIDAKQNFNSNIFNSFVMRLQVCLDASLAEVVSYQGEKAIPYFINMSESQSKDEKNQQNRFLTEWLESIFISGVNPDIGL